MNLPRHAFLRSDDAPSGSDLGRGAAAGKKRSPAANDGGDAPTESEVKLRIVSSKEEFERMDAAWSDLHAESPAASVFTSHEWLYAWWTAYRPPAELAIVTIDDGRLVAIAPMMIERRVQAGVARRVLRFIGDGTSETDHIDFLVRVGASPSVLPQLLRAIAALRWDVAAFNAMPSASPSAAALREWIVHNRFHVSEHAVECPVRRLPRDFDALLASLPARLRTSIRAARRNLSREHRVEFGLHERADEVPAALDALFANHTSRWQGKGKTGVFADPRKRDFYARLTPRLLARGWLRFFYLKLDERIVAQQYCFALNGTVMLLQEGFDFAHAKDNVGNALRARVFEYLIASGAQCYDFLAGTSRHKASWSDGVVYDTCIACARRSLKGFVFFALPQAWRRTKDRLRPWRDRVQAIWQGARETGGA